MTKRAESHKFVLLNGPPRAGKDTIAKKLVESDKFDMPVRLYRLAGVLKDRTHGLYGLSRDVSHDFYENIKDRPSDDFLGLTPRQAYIEVAERYFKPLHGDDVFFHLLSRQINKVRSSIIVVPDLGFHSEYENFVNKYGADNILLVVISREGHNFDNDSREYVTTSDDNGNRIYNNEILYVQNPEGYPEQLTEIVENHAAKIFNKKQNLIKNTSIYQ